MKLRLASPPASRPTLILLILALAIGGKASCSQAPSLPSNQERSKQERSNPESQFVLRLLPAPREYSARGTVPLDHGVSVTTGPDPQDRFAARDLLEWLQALHIPPARGRGALHIALLRANSREAQRLLSQSGVRLSEAMQQEGYAMLPTAHGAAVLAETDTGLFYGEQTLKQMVMGTGVTAVLAKAVIRDWPAMRYRGLSDDLSRGPIPTLDFAERQIRTLAAYKINIYSPYFENSLAYQSSPLAAIPGESWNQTDAISLVGYARRFHVTIVPEQEAFGHLHSLLTYEQYAPLAEAPLGSVLAPGQPGSLDLIAQWFDEIGKIFPGPFLHVGADETFELGQGRTKAEVQADGLGKVYVDFLARIHAQLAPLHKRLLFWGDVAVNDPGEVKRIPHDMIAVAWSYSPQSNGYASLLKPYTDAGIETWVAPGVSNWNRVFPDNDYALRNIQRFASDGQAAHSTGLLNTVWNDDGEGLFFEDWYGVLFGAASAWQAGTSSLEDFQASYGVVFHGDATGKVDQAQRELIAANQLLDQAGLKEPTDVLYWVDPWSPEGQAMAIEMLPMISQLRLHAERAITLLAQARAAGQMRELDTVDAIELGARRLDFIGQKFATADQIARVYNAAYTLNANGGNFRQVFDLLRTLSGASGLCQDMRDRYTSQRAAYSALWSRENQPEWLQNILARYDLATQLWTVRGDRFAVAQRSWTNGRTLPSPAELGIPGSGENVH
jgi:hexosaminidase